MHIVCGPYYMLCLMGRTNCVQAVVQRENLLLHEIYKIDLNESGIPTPRFNYSGSHRGALTIMILARP